MSHEPAAALPLAEAGASATPTVPVTRFRAVRAVGEEHTCDHEPVAQEVPVAIVLNGLSHAVLMATPDDLEALALGFALSEGVLRTATECHDAEVVEHGTGIEVRLQIASERFVNLKQQRRAFAGRTGCGLCGKESLAMLDLSPARVARAAWSRDLNTDALLRAARALHRHQPMNAEVGSLHAAAWCDTSGTVVLAREDIGRHNALDKLIGALARKRADASAGFVLMSSRLSYELVSKCARAGIGVLAGVSGPSALAITLARQADMALYGYCRADRVTRYAP